MKKTQESFHYLLKSLFSLYTDFVNSILFCSFAERS
ncbi:hypothetical protein EVA_10227 [gut metagenome]|uniref:Uncharacterized protein n=1 Tax=gut metagenome TaxID=749906 RepID=J9G492_9ZZZZ